MSCLLWTGQTSCHDLLGREIPCAGTGQDGAFRAGIPWPEPRFGSRGDTVVDALTGLTWSRCATPLEFPLTWREALSAIGGLNAQRWLGRSDWRLPNRRELRSLVSYQTRRPALPEGHPFTDLFVAWFWTSTTVAGLPAYAWWVNLDGGRMFFGGKDQSFLAWPVSGKADLPATGQDRCYDQDGREIACGGSGQDGELRQGHPWPAPRLETTSGGVLDRLTGLVWHRDADICRGAVSWADALEAVAALEGPWRLPNVNELESLVDCSRSAPALPAGADFSGVCDTYWSSSTSLFEADWAWALYLERGGIGVGQKRGRHFHVWAVRTGSAE
jgi:hypothetical protein